MKANTIKNVFTMASLYFLKNLLNISCKLLPFLIIALSLLNLSNTIVLTWRVIVLLLILEAILIIGTIIFYSLFFKKEIDNNKTDNAENKENTEKPSEDNSKTDNENIQTKNKLPILNIAVAFLVFLTFIFIILKLFNAVTWNFVWVLFPLWFSTALIIAILIIFVIYLIISIIAKKNNKNDNKANMESADNTENNNDSELNN